MTMLTIEDMRATRRFVANLDAALPNAGCPTAAGYVYFGGYWIEQYDDGRCSAVVCNGEHVGPLAECEQYLWDQWVANDMVGHDLTWFAGYNDTDDSDYETFDTRRAAEEEAARMRDMGFGGVFLACAEVPAHDEEWQLWDHPEAFMESAEPRRDR